MDKVIGLSYILFVTNASSYALFLKSRQELMGEKNVVCYASTLQKCKLITSSGSTNWNLLAKIVRYISTS